MPIWLREILDWIAANMEATALIGGGLAVAMGYVTGLFKGVSELFAKSKPEAKAPPGQTTGDGGVNVGGNVHGNVRTDGGRGPDDPAK